MRKLILLAVSVAVAAGVAGAAYAQCGPGQKQTVSCWTERGVQTCRVTGCGG
jgi:hypothetical protein